MKYAIKKIFFNVDKCNDCDGYDDNDNSTFRRIAQKNAMTISYFHSIIN